MYFLDIFPSIVTIVAFLGVSGMIFITNKNIAQILEHSPETLFGYYSKMKVYLIELKITLGQEDDTPLLALLSDREDKSISLDDDSVKKLQNVVDDIMAFFKTQDWQIPLDFNFEKDLSVFLREISYLENGNFSKCYSDNKDIVNKYKYINNLIDNLINKITISQNEIAIKTKQSQESLIVKIKRKLKLNKQDAYSIPQNIDIEDK